MSRRSRIPGWSCALFLLLGCVTTTENLRVGTFTPTGFYNRALPYRVSYLDPAQQRLLGPVWTLDNFRAVKKSRKRTVLEAKEEGDDLHDVVLLERGDSLEERRVYKQDLRFVHAPSGSTIWLTSIPVPARLAGATLFQLSALHLAALEARGFPSAGLGLRSSQPRFRSRVLSQRDARVDGLKAFETTVELQPHAQGAESTLYVRFVLVAPPYEWRMDETPYPALMVLGHASSRAHFAQVAADFERFVSQLELGYDAALRTRTKQVLACTEPARDLAQVEVEVSGRGEITGVEPLQPWVVPSETSAYQSDEASNEKRARHGRAQSCLTEALGGLRLHATGEDRDVLYWFDRRKQPAVRTEGGYRAGPFTGEPLAAPASTAQAPTDAASAAVAPPLPPEAEPEAHVALRAQLEARRQDLFACMGDARVALELSYENAMLRVELREPLRGSPEQACVQQVLRDVAAPAGTGRVLHVLSSER